MDVARWALANGHPLQRDCLAVIIGTRELNQDGTICTRWNYETVDSFLTLQAGPWCSMHRVRFPDQLTESLRTYLHYLERTRLLGDLSDGLEDLLDSVTDNEDTRVAAHESNPPSRRHNPRPATPGPPYGNLIQLMPKKSSIAPRPS